MVRVPTESKVGWDDVSVGKFDRKGTWGFVKEDISFRILIFLCSCMKGNMQILLQPKSAAKQKTTRSDDFKK